MIIEGDAMRLAAGDETAEDLRPPSYQFGGSTTPMDIPPRQVETAPRPSVPEPSFT
jgi:hypothetical protein